VVDPFSLISKIFGGSAFVLLCNDKLVGKGEVEECDFSSSNTDRISRLDWRLVQRWLR
jgi:hypothetical protein